MKKSIGILVAFLTLVQPYSASAKCDPWTDLNAGGLMMTILFAPLGTTLYSFNHLGGCDREMVLAYQEDAKSYQLTRVASPMLEAAIQAAQERDPSMTADQVVENLLAFPSEK